MNRFARIALTGIFAVLTSASVEAQQAGQGQRGQGQAGQQGAPKQGTAGQQGAYHGGIGQTPWFNNQDVRQQFKLTDQQYNQLNKSYVDSYGQYQQGIKTFDKGLTAEQRYQKMAELQQDFNKNFSASAGKVITDPQQRERYNQMYLQYQGYNAFSNPMVQEKLNLTAEQRQQLSKQSQEWHKQMNDLGRTYQTDPATAAKKYNEMRRQSGTRINTVLTPDQQKVWQQLTGEPYNFQLSSYFQTPANTGGGATNDRR